MGNYNRNQHYNLYNKNNNMSDFKNKSLNLINSKQNKRQNYKTSKRFMFK